MTHRDDGWAGARWETWQDLDEIRRRLDQGADPDALVGGDRPLHRAVEFGTPEVVAELAGRVGDVDAIEEGTTALWEAVVNNRPDNARALVAAGADPWRPVCGGWSPGRISLAGPTPDLFAVPAGQAGRARLTEAERSAAQEASRLVSALGDLYYEGFGLACVAGIDAEEAIRRLEATRSTREDMDDVLEDPYDFDIVDSPETVGVTTVPGGCVVTQPWGYAPQMPGVLKRLSAGTVCYGLYANPKSGEQGSIARDGVVEGWDLCPGLWPEPADSPEEVLACYLYLHHAVAYACAFAGLRLTDARPVTGPADVWVELPERDYWHE